MNGKIISALSVSTFIWFTVVSGVVQEKKQGSPAGLKRKVQMKLLKFKCPECKGVHALDEVVVDANVYNEVKGLEEGEDWPEYGVCGTIEGGTIYAYQCAGCGYRLPGITSPEELVEYLKEKGVDSMKEQQEDD